MILGRTHARPIALHPFRIFPPFQGTDAGQSICITTCGTALSSGSQVVVDDITMSPIFLGTASLEAMLDARARAVQSTPIIGPTGLLGMISTHYHRPVHPSESALVSLEGFANKAARIIEG